MRKVEESYLDVTTTLYDASDEVTKQDGSNDGIWYFGDRLNLQQEVIVGFSPTNYHAFISSGDLEVHPRFSFNKVKLKKARKGSLRAQVFLRIRGLDEDEIKGIQKSLNDLIGRRTMSCVEGVRQALYYGGGLEVPSMGGGDLYITQFLYKALKDGIKRRDGRFAEVEIYRTRAKSLEQIFKEINYFERSFNAIGVVSYYLFKMLHTLRLGTVAPMEVKKPGFFNYL